MVGRLDGDRVLFSELTPGHGRIKTKRPIRPLAVKNVDTEGFRWLEQQSKYELWYNIGANRVFIKVRDSVKHRPEMFSASQLYDEVTSEIARLQELLEDYKTRV